MVLGDSGQSPMARGDGPAVLGDLGPFPRDRVLNSCPADLHLGPRAPGVDQLSRAMRACATVFDQQSRVTRGWVHGPQG